MDPGDSRYEAVKAEWTDQYVEVNADRPELKEYTEVITEEALRLQTLVDRLLAPHRSHNRGPINIHEVLERVRSIALAQHPQGLAELCGIAVDCDLA